MFYSHTYLKRNGRFGLIWLAATQSKVLNKRELYTINLSMTCSDILSHVPGYSSKLDPSQRPRRFSLYLSSQLMYGSVRVLQKQWEYLFLDVTTLFRRFHPDIPSDIDLIIMKQDPVTIASCIPSHKFYDPFFGVYKDSTVNVEDYLDVWNNNFEASYGAEQVSPSVLQYMGSPALSVSDQRDIQIRDLHEMPLETLLPGEQDLPDMDLDNLELLRESEDVILSAQELITSHVSRILTVTDVTETHIRSYLDPSLQETPAVRTGDEPPRTPQKPKRKRQQEGPDMRRPKHKVTEIGEGLAGTSVDEQDAAVGLAMSPVMGLDQRPHGHDWLQQQQPQVQLSPVTPSPTRRRRVRRLIVDQTLQLTREDIRHNMETSASTSQPLILPSIYKGDLYKQSGSKALQNSAVSRLWSRNCVFGLRVYDTGSESSSPPPLTGPETGVDARERAKRKLGETQTPVVRQQVVEKSLTLSVERRRDISTRSASFEEHSRSLILAQTSDDSSLATSAKKQRLSAEENLSIEREGPVLLELDQTAEMVEIMPSVPEEQEYLISPIPLPAGLDHREELGVVTDGQDVSGELSRSEESPGTHLLKCVQSKLRSVDDWTTFRMVCPPSACNKEQAATMFAALLGQVGQRNLCIRQDEPYSDIFIWLSSQPR